MNKMFLFLAAGFGAAILAGCSDPVMDNRYYKDNDGTDVVAPAPASDEAVAAQPAETAPAGEVKELPETKDQPKQAKSVRTYEPMQQLDSDKIAGIDENYKAAKSGKAKVYTVRKGDTLGKIAYRNRVSLSALLEANNMSLKEANRLRIGQKLNIPAPGTKAAVSKKAVKNTKTTKAAAKKSSAKKSDAQVNKSVLNADGTYSVKRGDSPERIARKLKVKLDDLLKANNLDDAASRRLQIGQKLIVPAAGAVAVSPVEKKDAPAAVETTTTTDAAPAAPNAADDLAKQLESTLPAPAAPTAGNEAAAAPAAGTETSAAAADELHVVQEAEISLADFAKKYNVTVEDLKRLNPGVPEVLTRNEVINLPSKK